MIVEVFVALDETIDALSQKFDNAVFDPLRRSRVRQLRRHAIEQADLFVRLADEQQACIRSDVTTVKSNLDSASPDAPK